MGPVCCRYVPGAARAVNWAGMRLARRPLGPRRAPRSSVTSVPPPAPPGLPADRLCQHAGVCINAGRSHHCQCPLGYTGSYCEEQLDECASHPCQHGATCSDFIGGYGCEVSRPAGSRFHKFVRPLYFFASRRHGVYRWPFLSVPLRGRSTAPAGVVIGFRAGLHGQSACHGPTQPRPPVTGGRGEAALRDAPLTHATFT